MIIKRFMEELTFLGGIVFYVLFSLWFLFKKEYGYFAILVLGLIMIYFVTFLIRIFYFKQRPEKIKYRSIIEKLDASSFPSVHSARATFLFLLFTFYFLNLAYLLITFVLTLFVLYSRIYLKKHDLTDVIGGVILGMVVFFSVFLFSYLI